MPAPASIEASRVDDVAVLRVEGRLDAAVAPALQAAVRAAIADGAGQVDLDLRGVTDWDDDGAAALVACRRAAARAAGGLRYLVGAGAGQEALLAAFAADVV